MISCLYFKHNGPLLQVPRLYYFGCRGSVTLVAGLYYLRRGLDGGAERGAVFVHQGALTKGAGFNSMGKGSGHARYCELNRQEGR